MVSGYFRTCIMFRISIFLTLAMNIPAQEINKMNQMEGFVVNGSPASIKNYPHSVFLSTICRNSIQGPFKAWICGASLLNQQILLTAGHCLYLCAPSSSRVTAHLGSNHRKKGLITTVKAFIVHKMFEEDTNESNIAIARLAHPVQFTENIRRVAIMQNPPYSEPADFAGWGDLNEKTGEQGYYLMETTQKLWKPKSCVKLLGSVPRGSFCASSPKRTSYPSWGDSGSALVVRGYIQIGLVSYKVPGAAVNVIVYIDVGYYFNWIRFNSKRLYCAHNNRKNDKTFD